MTTAKTFFFTWLYFTTVFKLNSETNNNMFYFHQIVYIHAGSEYTIALAAVITLLLMT